MCCINDRRRSFPERRRCFVCLVFRRKNGRLAAQCHSERSRGISSCYQLASLPFFRCLPCGRHYTAGWFFAIHHKTPRLVLQSGIVRSTGEDCGQHRAWKLKQLLIMSFSSVNEKILTLQFFSKTVNCNIANCIYT